MVDQPQPAEGQCAFFLPKKKRFCRFRPNQGQKYCAEHACILGVELDRKRIVCPLNPKHTCYEDNLDKHLKKCNSRKRRTEEYYEEGINTGSDEGDSVPDTQTAVKATGTERLKQMIERVNQLYEEHIGEVEEDVRSHECLREEMENPYFGLSALRHRRQQASLIGQLEGLGLLAPGHCYIEMGAGKGQLSHWVRQAVSSHDDAAFLLVDRSSIRYKVDGYHKEEEKVKFERIKMDIEHLCLGKVPMVAGSQKPLVAMGKHLCGAATDLTLRCLMETVSHRPTDTATTEPIAKRPRTDGTDSSTPTDCSGVASPRSVSDSSEKCGREGNVDEKDIRRNNQVVGVLIALCCHHQCSWWAYVGKDFMRQCGLTAADFHLLTRLTSWAVCGWRDRDGSFGTKDKTTNPPCQDKKMDNSTINQSQTDSSRTDQSQTNSTNTSQSKTDGSNTDQSAEQVVLENVDNNTVEEEVEHDTADLVSDTDKEDGLQLTEKQKERVGWRCKRLIDYGRVCYLRDQGLRSNLKIYIDAQQTPENVVLVATPITTNSL